MSYIWSGACAKSGGLFYDKYHDIHTINAFSLLSHIFFPRDATESYKQFRDMVGKNIFLSSLRSPITSRLRR